MFGVAVEVLYLDSKELVELSQGQVFVFHLPPRVLDGMNGAVEEPGGGGRECGEVLMPRQRHIYQLVEEETLDCLRVKY